MQTAFPLVNESQISTRLNHAVEHNRRGEFALLLSLMSVDVRDMAQFQWDAQLDLDSRLRKQFELPKTETLLADLSTDEEIIDNSHVFREQGEAQFRLQQALRPEAVLTRGHEPQGLAEALANCDHISQLRQRQQLTLPHIEIPHFVDQLAMQRNLAKIMAQA